MIVEKFNDFLSNINLNKYREKYSKIKLVELDLPRDIQALILIYDIYWNKREFISYEDFYKEYSTLYRDKLEEFRIKTMFSEETFYRGIPARIYRTWASLLTQIQGGFVAESLHDKVEMSAELDYAGIDMRVYINSGNYINIQIKKESMSREVRTPWKNLKKGVQITNITYEVPTSAPLTKAGKEAKPYKDWREKWGDKLSRLDNGFVIFQKKMFELDNINTP